MRRPVGAAGLLISMTERHLHSQGGIEKGKIRLSKTPLWCGQVLTSVTAIRKEANRGERLSAECRALQGATAARAVLGKSFHVSAFNFVIIKAPQRQEPPTLMKTLTNHRGSPNRNLPSRGFLKSEASSSLSRSKKLLLTKPLKSEGIIEDSQRQESSSHEASPRRGFVPKIPTSAETVGKAQEALSQVVQEREALETRPKEVQQAESKNGKMLVKMKTLTDH